MLHPAVTIEVDATDELRDLTDASIDVAIRVLRPHDSTIISRKIAALSAVTLAAPDYLAKAGIPSSPQDLGLHRCIGYRYASTGRVADLQFKMRGKTVSLPSSRGSSSMMSRQHARSPRTGKGSCSRRARTFRPFTDSGRLVRILAEFTAKPWQLYVCYANRRQLPLRARAFIDFIG